MRMRPRRLVLLSSITAAALAIPLGFAIADASAATGPTAGPTAGLTPYTDTYTVQHLYNLPQPARFSVTNGVYSLWVLKGDKGFSRGTRTGSRTEQRWAANWSSGEHLFDADVMIDAGTTGTAIMQVHAVTPGEAIYIQTKNGNLYNSVNTLLATN